MSDLQEKVAEVLASYQVSPLAGSLVVTLTQLVALCCPSVCADQRTLWVALLELQRQKKVAVSLHDGETVKGGAESRRLILRK